MFGRSLLFDPEEHAVAVATKLIEQAESHVEMSYSELRQGQVVPPELGAWRFSFGGANRRAVEQAVDGRHSAGRERASSFVRASAIQRRGAERRGERPIRQTHLLVCSSQIS